MSHARGDLRRDRRRAGQHGSGPARPRAGGSSAAPRSRAAVCAAAVAMALVVVHIVLTAVFNAPNAAIRDRGGLGGVASAYIEPYLTQDYRMYAPDPLRADRALWVRATIVPTDGDALVTGWVDTTEIELASPARRMMRPQPSLQVAGRLVAAFYALSAEQRLASAEDYSAAEDLAPLQEGLLEADPNREDEALAFVRATNVAVSYGTQAARALWGEAGDVVAIETRVVSTPVPGPDGSEPATAPDGIGTGWRPAIDWAAQDDEAFAATFLAWAEQAGVRVGLGSAAGGSGTESGEESADDADQGVADEGGEG